MNDKKSAAKMAKYFNQGVGKFHTGSAKQYLNAPVEKRIVACASSALALRKEVAADCNYDLLAAAKKPEDMAQEEKVQASQELMALGLRISTCIDHALFTGDKWIMSLKVHDLIYAAMSQLGLLNTSLIPEENK